MTEPAPDFTVRIERRIAASPEVLFDAWTRAELLVKWWGPVHARCSGAAVDLRVGGRYHIDNELPSGAILRIEGVFERVERPGALVYTWQIGDGPTERVTVTFDGDAVSTRVAICHERIATKRAADEHGLGWNGCLDGLGAYVSALPTAAT